MSQTAEERFNSHIDKSGECWVWTAAKQPNGYGVFRPTSKKTDPCTRAHRFAYELAHGPIPVKLQIDHICRNRACVKPEHLRLVTLLENLQLSPITNHGKTVCKHGHVFTVENTYYYKGQRGCKECRRRLRLESYHRRKSNF